MLTVIIALGANALIAVLKTIVAVFTGSASMVAEAAHSWADTGNEIFLLIAERKSSREPDGAHPFGHGREAYLWSMLAAFGLFAVGSAVSIAHGLQSLGEPDITASYGWAYAVLGVSFVLEGISFLRARREAHRAAADRDVRPRDFLMDTSNPTLRAVYAEDASALLGIIFAASGLALHEITGNAVFDALGSILVGILLGVVAVWLIRRNMAFLNGQVVDDKVRSRALTWLLEQPDVTSVSFLHLEYVGPSQVMVLAAVDLEGNDAESQAATEMLCIQEALEAHANVTKAIVTLSEPGAEPLTKT